MDACEKEAIRLKYTFLLSNLNMDVNLNAHLYQYGLLTLDDKERLTKQVTRQDKADLFLHLVQNHCKSPDTFHMFMRCLRESDNQFIADELEQQLYMIRSQVMDNKSGSWMMTHMTEAGRQRLITPIELSQISMQIGQEWMRLGIEMGLPKPRLEQFQMQNPYSPSNVILTMLQEWRQRAGRNGSVQMFVKHCQNAGVPEDSYKPVILKYMHDLCNQSNSAVI